VNGVWGVVPVKCFARGKSRLGAVLSRAERSALARELCEHVLGVLSSCEEIAGVLVVTDCAIVERYVAARGAHVIRDASRGSLAAIADQALGELARRGARGALVLMSDLPVLERSDVVRLVAALDEAPVVLAPDLLEYGTNALALSPPNRLATCFGSETSFDRHLARARASDLSVVVHRSEGTGRDLDSPDDLTALGVDRAELCSDSPSGSYGDRGARLSWKRNRSSRVRAA
jgi:2-phospho-L-lactate guanylyltransferase